MDIAPNILYNTLFMVNSTECLSANFSGHASVPRNIIGKHFDLINAKRTSSKALRPIFQNVVESLIKASFVLGKRAFELSRTF